MLQSAPQLNNMYRMIDTSLFVLRHARTKTFPALSNARCAAFDEATQHLNSYQMKTTSSRTLMIWRRARATTISSIAAAAHNRHR